MTRRVAQLLGWLPADPPDDRRDLDLVGQVAALQGGGQ